jgi:hypothetical protein
LLRQDRDFEKVVKYYFLQVQSQVELSRDNKDGEFTSLFSSFVALFIHFYIHFSSLHRATLQETIIANNN